MAEINLKQDGKRRKLPMPRIDLTPMVDLGFLLITFFMYTTTLAKPNCMALNMPDREDTTKHHAWPKESTMVVMPAGREKIFYYKGTFGDEEMQQTDQHHLRDVIISEAKAARSLPASFSLEAHQVHIIIKPNDNCSYSDLIAVLDEMKIMAVPYYAVVDISVAEKETLTKKLQNKL